MTEQSSRIRSAEIFRLFQKWKDRPFVFVNPGGNHGDALIWAGAYKLANLAELDYSNLQHDAFLTSNFSHEHVIYIHGGGGFVNHWSGMPFIDLEYAVNNHPGTVIFGPQSGFEKDFLREKFAYLSRCKNPERIYLFLRDKYSYDLFREVVPSGVNVLLDHDTATNLEKNDFQEHPEWFPEGKHFHFKGGYDYYAIRSDKEATSKSLKDIFRLSIDPVEFAGPFFWKWFEVHRAAKRIYTNRLHSAILGSILEIPTYLASNSWHKIRGVWEHSLQEKGVHWIDELPDVSLTSRLLNVIPGGKKVLNSYRIKRLSYKMLGAFDSNNE